MQDKRFAHIAKDPKFRRIPKAESKVKIDRRFQSMFTDKKFQIKYTTDKRGRPVKHHSKEDLKRYYDVSSSDDESESSEEQSVFTKPGRFVKAPKSDPESSKSDTEEEESVNKLNIKDKSDKKLPETVKRKLQDLNVDYARGEQTLCTDSSSDDEETDDELSESEEIDHGWGELDADAGQTAETTYRLAACNLDWDRIRATDLMVLFNSFLPPGGVILSVAIYPSEYGKQRLKEEEVKGPIELVESKNELQPDKETEEGSKYHMEKLRQYQLNRLKYYYAVVTFDTANSANKVYTECDGMEYESSATKIDLRFIPDDMTFDEPPKESCDKLPDKYEPRFFTTTALQQAKVELTWDETNPDRLEFAEKINSGKTDDISERDLQNYLAASSDEEDLNNKSGNSGSDSEDHQSGNIIDKYKALLQDIEEKEEEKKNKNFEMEISWGIDLKEKTDKLLKDKQQKSEDKAPFQKYLEKRKERRKERKMKKKSSEDKADDSDILSDVDMNDPYFAEEFNNPEFKKKTNKKKNRKDNVDEHAEEDKQKRAELDLLLMNGEDTEEKKHFNFKEIQEKESEIKSKKKRKKKKQDEEQKHVQETFKVNVEDNRFSAIFTSHLYNIDPTDPHYKKTKGMELLIEEKIKRRDQDSILDNQVTKKAKKDREKKRDTELNVLIKNVKRKAQGFSKKS